MCKIYGNFTFWESAQKYKSGDQGDHSIFQWSDSNHRLFHEMHTQQPQKLNVWVGIFYDRLGRMFIVTGNLTGVMYLPLLEYVINPALTDTIGNDQQLIN